VCDQLRYGVLAINQAKRPQHVLEDVTHHCNYFQGKDPGLDKAFYRHGSPHSSQHADITSSLKNDHSHQEANFSEGPLDQPSVGFQLQPKRVKAGM
jgi:hypothetical protein